MSIDNIIWFGFVQKYTSVSEVHSTLGLITETFPLAKNQYYSNSLQGVNCNKQETPPLKIKVTILQGKSLCSGNCTAACAVFSQ